MRHMTTNLEPGCALLGLVIFFLTASAWFTHVITCLQEEAWGFLIAGALAFPIAIIHGFGIWFGLF